MESFLASFNETVVNMIGWGILETFYMTFGATFFAYIIGLPVGTLLVLTDKRGMHPIPWLNSTINIVVNILRSVPFLILFIVMIPFVRLVVGQSYGPSAATVGLIVAAAPFVARLVEQSLQEVDGGVIEAALSMGASPRRILWKVMLPEAMPSMIVGSTIATTTILGYSAMAGFMASGGLGDIAIRYGFKRYEAPILFVVVILLVIIVQLLQEAGMKLAKTCDKRSIG